MVAVFNACGGIERCGELIWEFKRFKYRGGFQCCQGCYFYYDSDLVFFCIHKSSRVVHQFSQGLEIGVSRGMRGALRLWTSSLECCGIWQGSCNCPSETKKSQHHQNEHFWKGFTPKWVKCCKGGGRVGEEKTFIHFVLIAFILWKFV